MLEIKELSDLERLKLSLEYSISKKHRESLIARIGIDRTEVNENKDDVVNNNSTQMEQVGFF